MTMQYLFKISAHWTILIKVHFVFYKNSEEILNKLATAVKCKSAATYLPIRQNAGS